MEVSGHRKIWIPKLRWNDVIRKCIGVTVTSYTRSTRRGNVDNENWIHRPHTGRTPNKKKRVMVGPMYKTPGVTRMT